MANMKEVKSRINSVRDTQKITNAMYLIASTKLRRAKSELDRTRPYFNALRGEIKRIFRTAGDVESRYFYPADGSDAPDGVYACLVITADKGLAGSYNQNVIKKAERLLGQHPNTRLFVVGEYGRRYFEQHRIPVERSFLYTAQNPTMRSAREICALLLELFDTGAADRIFVVYTDMQSGLEGVARSTRLIPFHRQEFAPADKDEAAVKEPFEFFPSVEAVLENIMQSYITGFVYSALVDSFCSEQNARMTAMDAANRNAEKILGDLSGEYNRVRQAAITREITEISAGARAKRQQRQKNEAKEADAL